MIDIDTFLTMLYVMVDDFDKACLPPEHRPGPPAALTRAEVITLAMMGQWQPFTSERAFYRYAQRHWRGAFPTLPDRANSTGWCAITTRARRLLSLPGRGAQRPALCV